MDWTPPPEPLTWTLPKPIPFGSVTYSAVTLRAPTAGDMLKAMAIPGASPYQVAMRLIAGVSAESIPYEALASVPAYVIEQMSNYLDTFGGAPLPDPLDGWRKAQLAAVQADALEALEAASASPAT